MFLRGQRQEVRRWKGGSEPTGATPERTGGGGRQREREIETKSASFVSARKDRRGKGGSLYYRRDYKGC